jgi:AcrR family transcriptional regulator
MSLYHYGRGKDELFDGMVDIVLSEIEHPPADEHWKAALRRIALSHRMALARHPWAASVMYTRTDALPGRTRYMETVLRTLSDAGFTPELTDLAYHALESHIMGFTLWAASFRGMTGKLEELATAFLRSLPADEYPHLIQHIQQHLAPPKQPRSAFEFGLDLILDGLERLREDPSQLRDAAPSAGAARSARVSARARPRRLAS